MQARREVHRRARPRKPELKKAAQGCITGVAANSTDAATATVVDDNGHVLTISDFLTRFDEVARRRLNNLNQKLRSLEMHMEVLEAEMSKAYESSK